MRYHLIPVWTAVIKKKTDDKTSQGCGEEGTLTPLKPIMKNNIAKGRNLIESILIKNLQ